MMADEHAVRQAFRQQAQYCRELGSPFTALLCDTLASRLDLETALGRKVLSWPGKPDAVNDSLPLRLAGGLNALAMSGLEPALTALYPPHSHPGEDAMWAVLSKILATRGADLLPWLEHPPQTNEVARSAVLMAGLLAVASETKLPLRLYEIGASAGLNLILDRYSYRLGEVETGTPGAKLRLAPRWSGASPPQASVRVVGRHGVDLSPIDVSTKSGRERLLAYVWPDQTERVMRTRAALEIASAEPPHIDTGDAANWVESQIFTAPEEGVARVLMHSVAFQYFPADTQKRIEQHVRHIGNSARANGPFAWLHMEGKGDARFYLTLTTWPSGEERVLAIPHPHGTSIDWK
jgi:hypothetical protein